MGARHGRKATAAENFRRWMRAPRQPLNYVDRFYETNAYALALMGLFYYGIRTRDASGWQRLGGAVLLLLGVLLAAFVTLYLQKPVDPAPADRETP